MNKKIKVNAIYGTGGFAREVMPLLKENINIQDKSIKKKILFIDDFLGANSFINGIEVVSFNYLKDNYSNIECCIAIADKNTRKKLSQKCSINQIKLKSIISRNSVIMDNVELGEGSILSPFVTITSNVKIGQSFHANIYSYIAHDCIIGDFVTFAPGVKCNGNVHIHDGVYIGTGAIIHPGKKGNPIIIGKNSKIAAGAVITKNVPENVTMIGNPAKILSLQLIKKMKMYD